MTPSVRNCAPVGISYNSLKPAHSSSIVSVTVGEGVGDGVRVAVGGAAVGVQVGVHVGGRVGAITAVGVAVGTAGAQPAPSSKSADAARSKMPRSAHWASQFVATLFLPC